MASRVHQPMEPEEFDFILAKSPRPVLAFFSGTWPKAVNVCREMDSVVRELAQEYDDRLTAVKVDMTRCPEPTRRFGVTGAPTFLLIKQGEAVATWQGPLDGEELRKFVATHV
ncbi:thioredoxin family protein [Streptomyces sp. NBC_01304]|uniref:thioredoxin family protein n=1 Tax=Streptomyces sp. NBC_01304 TaxID=2903818 RepID=UPI002E0D58D7|nr:thioredoxin family protein [Streptomyces sp. NBC_01304]